MTQYALCYVEHNGLVLLIEKKKPAWQLGMFNLPGGKIEGDETAEEAAIRELREETNLQAIAAQTIGRITGPDYDVYVVNCDLPCESRCINDMRQMTSERPFWMGISRALKEERLIQNLLAIIPLAHQGVTGWVIYAGPYLPDNQYIVELPCVSQPT